MTHELYTRIHILLAEEAKKAIEEREEAVDRLAYKYVDLYCFAAARDMKKIKEATKRMREMKSLLEQFEKEVEEPEEMEREAKG